VDERARLARRGPPLPVVFALDNGRRVRRDMRWDPDARYWWTPFGGAGPLARNMKAAYGLRVNVPGAGPAASSDFTLDRSWRTITRMQEICRM
jgi:hypothetical protein